MEICDLFKVVIVVVTPTNIDEPSAYNQTLIKNKQEELLHESGATTLSRTPVFLDAASVTAVQIGKVGLGAAIPVQRKCDGLGLFEISDLVSGSTVGCNCRCRFRGSFFKDFLTDFSMGFFV